MNILEKFNAVKISGTERLTESDLRYCEKNQMAYEAAVKDFTDLLSVWEGICSRQKEYLPETDEKRKLSPYLSMGKQISSEGIRTHLEQLDWILIVQIVNEICSRYHVTIDREKIRQAVSRIGKDPAAEKAEGETKPPCRRILHYEEIVDQIFLQFSGRNLWEQAEYELKDRCFRNSRNYNGEPGYEKKNGSLIFPYGCSFRRWMAVYSWELEESLKEILWGIAHYERNDFRLPQSIAEVLCEYRLKNSEISFPDCKKVQSMKLYKNGRVDIRFRESRYLEQFVKAYLQREEAATTEEKEERNEISGSGS